MSAFQGPVTRLYFPHLNAAIARLAQQYGTHIPYEHSGSQYCVRTRNAGGLIINAVCGRRFGEDCRDFGPTMTNGNCILWYNRQHRMIMRPDASTSVSSAGELEGTSRWLGPADTEFELSFCESKLHGHCVQNPCGHMMCHEPVCSFVLGASSHTRELQLPPPSTQGLIPAADLADSWWFFGVQLPQSEFNKQMDGRCEAIADLAAPHLMSGGVCRLVAAYCDPR